MEARGRPLGEVVRLIDEHDPRELGPTRSTSCAAPERSSACPINVLLISRSGRGIPHRDERRAHHERSRPTGGRGRGFPRHYPAPPDRTDPSRQRSPDPGGTAGRNHCSRNPQPSGHRLQPLFLLQHESYPNPETKHYLDMASEELGRITQITGQLLTFHREAQSPVAGRPRQGSGECAHSVCSADLHWPDIQVKNRFETIPPVRGFPGELRQVFANLVANAIHSMPNGGKLLLHVLRVEPCFGLPAKGSSGDRARQRHRHPSRRAQESVRAVLHHQGRRREPDLVCGSRAASSRSTKARSTSSVSTRPAEAAPHSRCSFPLSRSGQIGPGTVPSRIQLTFQKQEKTPGI